MPHIVTRYGIDIDLSVEGKVGCPKCLSKGGDRSHNNLHTYGLDGDGKQLGAYCWGADCGFTIPSDSWLEENKPLDLSEREYELVSTDFNEEVHDGIKSITSNNSKGYRGIKTSTSKFFGVRYECSQEDGKIVASYYPVTKGVTNGIPIKDAITGYKIRKHPKRFSCVGEVNKESDLFGQFRFTTHKGIVVVTAGEVDFLSMYQVLKEDYDKRGNKRYDEVAVVSPTNGEGGISQIQYHYDFFNQFNKIIIAYDNDEAGRKATDAVAAVLPRGKVFVMSLRKKDVNEYLRDGMERELISDFWGAKPYTPSGLVGSTSLSSMIREHALTEKVPLPDYMHRLQHLMAGGIPLSTIINLISSSGSGKSTHAEEMVYKWIFDSPYKVGIVSLESDSGEYGTKLLSRHVAVKINLMETPEEKIDFLNQEWVIAKEKELFFNSFGTDRFILLDDRDGDVEHTKDLITSMIVKLGVKLIILDPLQDLIACLNDAEQNEFMSWQKNLVKQYNVIIVNISHTKKGLTSGGAGSQGVDIVEEDAHGSSAIYKSGAANLLFSRNKESECEVEKNTTYMKMSKCRWTGNTSSVAGKYYYDNSTHTVHDFDDFMLANPHLIPDDNFGGGEL